jgi:hypothetical protein
LELRRKKTPSKTERTKNNNFRQHAENNWRSGKEKTNYVEQNKIYGTPPKNSLDLVTIMIAFTVNAFSGVKN